MNQKLTANFKPPASLLELVEPKSIVEQTSRIHDELSRRAFQIFEREGKFFGRDLEHWLKAEKELLHPAPVSVEEFERELIIDAEVPGFAASDLKVCLEPRKLTISGKKELRERPVQGKGLRQESVSSEILRIVELPVEVDVKNSVATLREGMLELKLPKAKTMASVVEIKAA